MKKPPKSMKRAMRTGAMTMATFPLVVTAPQTTGEEGREGGREEGRKGGV